MTVSDQLLALQWMQLKHDEGYHKDVAALPIAQRIKHMAFHYAKYAAYLLDAVERRDEARLRATLVDAFIISLATANILNNQLGAALEAEGTESLDDLGAGLAETLPRDAGDTLWLVKQFVRYTGRLAKMCESFDHLEPLPFRSEMTACNLNLLKVVLAESSARQLDLADCYRTRIRAVEARSMFDRQLKPGSGEHA
jgi:hypothetical protein